MTTTLSDGITTVTLPDDLDWTDEFAWTPVQQTVEQSVTGALLVQTGTAQAGRPITLQGADDRAWLRGYAAAAQIDTWSHVAGKQLTLVLRGAARTVIFRHHEAPAFEAREIFGEVPGSETQQFNITLKLMEI